MKPWFGNSFAMHYTLILKKKIWFSSHFKIIWSTMPSEVQLFQMSEVSAVVILTCYHSNLADKCHLTWLLPGFSPLAQLCYNIYQSIVSLCLSILLCNFSFYWTYLYSDLVDGLGNHLKVTHGVSWLVFFMLSKEQSSKSLPSFFSFHVPSFTDNFGWWRRRKEDQWIRFNKSNQLHTFSPSNDDFTEQFFSLLNYGAHQTYSIDLNRTQRIGFLLPQRFRELLLLHRSHHHKIVMGDVFSFNLNGNQCFDLAKLRLIESHALLHVTHVGAFL